MAESFLNAPVVIAPLDIFVYCIEIAKTRFEGLRNELRDRPALNTAGTKRLIRLNQRGPSQPQSPFFSETYKKSFGTILYTGFKEPSRFQIS